jgi:hypothetical protein
MNSRMNPYRAARQVLAESDCAAKQAGAARIWAQWQADELDVVADFETPINLAGIPDRPLCSPRQAACRDANSTARKTMPR